MDTAVLTSVLASAGACEIIAYVLVIIMIILFFGLFGI